MGIQCEFLTQFRVQAVSCSEQSNKFTLSSNCNKNIEGEMDCAHDWNVVHWNRVVDSLYCWNR